MTPREQGNLYMVQALRETVKLGALDSFADLRTRIGALADDAVQAVVTPLGMLQLPFISLRASSIGDDVKTAIGVNPLDVDTPGGVGLPTDLIGQQLSAEGQAAQAGSVSGQSAIAGDALSSIGAGIGSALGIAARDVLYVVAFVVILIAGAYAYKVARK